MFYLVLSSRLKLEFYVDCVGQFVSMIIWLGWQATLVALFGQVGMEYIHVLLVCLFCFVHLAWMAGHSCCPSGWCGIYSLLVESIASPTWRSI